MTYQAAWQRRVKIEPLALKLLPALVTILVISSIIPSHAYTSPLSLTPDFWSFAVRNEAFTTVVFPSWWPTLGPPTSEFAFEVEKSRHRYAFHSIA